MSLVLTWKALVDAARFVAEVVRETRALRRRLGHSHYSFES